jgi:protein TonB
MDANKTLNASFLDILFDGRNKEYGAYQLRKTYNIRLIKSLGGMVAVVLLCFGLYALSTFGSGTGKPVMIVQDVQLEDVRQEKKDEPPQPPPPARLQPAKVEITRFTPPRIVRDNEVKEEEKPPEQSKLEDTRIGSISQEGVKDEGIAQGAGSDAGKGVVAGPGAAAEDYGKTFMKVEIESEYPGGRAAWQRFLNKNFRFPDDALNEGIQGAVMVQFIVDRDGNVSDVHVVSGPDKGGLREEAIRVIAKSGKWIPGVQNGRQVKSYKNQPIIFMLASQ